MSDVHVSLPAERFYWGKLDVQSLPRGHTRDRKALGYRFESVLPVPIEELHAVYAYPAANPHQVIACGMAKKDIAELVHEQPSALTLTPRSVPPYLGVGSGISKQLNLLTGEFEPPLLRRARARALIQTAFLIFLATGLLSIGFHRRSDAIAKQVTKLHDQKRELIQETIGPTLASDQPPELRLLAELRSLQRTRGSGLSDAKTSDRDANLLASFAALFERWPSSLHIKTESLSITPTSMTVRGLAPSSADVQEFADALNGLSGWSLQQPQISSTGSGEVNATWQWKRAIDQSREASP